MKYFIHSRRFRLASAMVILFNTGLLYAQEEQTECFVSYEKNDKKEECLSSQDILGQFDLSTPENALFALMNSTPETIIRPKVGDSLMVSYLPVISDTLGNDNYSVGLEVNPGQLMQPAFFTAGELQGLENDVWKGSDKRVSQLKKAKKWSKVLFSIAASQSLADDGSLSRYGVGINYTDDSGSNFETSIRYGTCMKAAGTKWGGILSQLIDNELAKNEYYIDPEAKDFVDRHNINIEKAEDVVRKSDAFKNEYVKNISATSQRCSKQASPWNRNVLGGGLAFYKSESTDSGGNETDEDGYGVWLTYVRKIGHNGQLSIGGRFTDGYLQKIDNEQTMTISNGGRMGLRYTHEMLKTKNTERAFRGFIEVASVSEEIEDEKDEYTQAAVGFEIQISKELFFQAAIGDTLDSEIDRTSFLNGKLKWSFTSAPVR